MKSTFFLYVVVLSSLSCFAEASQPLRPQAPSGTAQSPSNALAKITSTDSRFDLVDIGYKKPQVLSDNFFNPFKVQADVGLSKKEGPGVTIEAVAAAIGQRGVSGVVYPSGNGAKRVIVGDQVFGVGDELSFPDGEKPGFVPLVSGATVVLREVGKDSLGFDVSAEGDTPRRVTFPLRSFWRP